MTLGLAFWVIVIIGFIFSLRASWPFSGANAWVVTNNFVLFVLIVSLGLASFRASIAPMRYTILLAVTLMFGCRSTQLPIESKVGYDPKTGAINLTLPKNSSGKELRFVQKVGTNSVLLVLKDFSFTNSPAVLDAAGAANVAAINAWGGIFNSMMETVKALAAKAPMGAMPEFTAPTIQYQLQAPQSLTFTNTVKP